MALFTYVTKQGKNRLKGFIFSCVFFFFSSRRRHTRLQGDWSSDVCSSDLVRPALADEPGCSPVARPGRRGRAPGRRAPSAALAVARVAPRSRCAQERRESRKEDGGRRTRRLGTNGGAGVGARRELRRVLLLAPLAVACGGPQPTTPPHLWHEEARYPLRAPDVPATGLPPRFTLP